MYKKQNSYDLDIARFGYVFQLFKEHIEKKSGQAFLSFSSNSFTHAQEWYKYDIFNYAQKTLEIEVWNESEVGSGKIVSRVIKAIEYKENNLVMWQARYGDEKRPHHVLHKAIETGENLKDIESTLFSLYKTDKYFESFSELTGIFGTKYPIIAYLYFIKDKDKFLPIAPMYFDKAFNFLGLDLKTSHNCSEENYTDYIYTVKHVKELLAEVLDADVSLLDAHSFLMMLVYEIIDPAQEHIEVNESSTQNIIESTEFESRVLSRRGQGLFRKRVIANWGGCSVTGLQNEKLLISSHIKPWKDADNQERLDGNNGFLLTPNLDMCFDKGLITFDVNGKVIISPVLKAEECEKLGIANDLKLIKNDVQIQKYLEYHRQHQYINDEA